MKSLKDWQYLENVPPRTLKIELTNICNANCVFCGYQYENRKKGIMSQELYLRVLKEYRGMGGENISFTSIVGEPFIDTNIIDRIRKAKEFGFKDIYTYTNGILLYRYDIKALLRSGINHLIISTSPFEKGKFERLYRNRDYDKLLEGLQKVLMINQQIGRPVKVEIAFRSDISLRKALLLNDYQKFIRPYINDERKEISILVKGYDNWSGMIKHKDLFGEMELASIPKYKLHPCSRTFSCMVMWDGYVRGCSCRFSNFDDEDNLIIGNLKDIDLKNIWFGDKVKQLRRSFVNNKLCITCRNCTMYTPV